MGNLSEEVVLEKLEELEGTPVDNDQALENLKLDDAKQDQLSIHWVSTYDERADFYSLGVIGMEIFSKSDSQMERGVKLRAVRDDEVLPDNIPSPEEEILQGMIRRDPNGRLWQEAVIRQQLQPVRPPPPDLREMMMNPWRGTLDSAHDESRQRTLDRLGVARRTDFGIRPDPRDVSSEFGIRSRPRMQAAALNTLLLCAENLLRPRMQAATRALNASRCVDRDEEIQSEQPSGTAAQAETAPDGYCIGQVVLTNQYGSLTYAPQYEANWNRAMIVEGPRNGKWLVRHLAANKSDKTTWVSPDNMRKP